ncbi:MarR family winged helix-turn-helix transcriptional regulator [Micropruina sp.]|uniref:MarR family winged helix-turn-helix transcriptional regulator n=1 Tax=Micropruina sp. TaxID=2737536 RepID=UPI0039E616C3
MQLSEELTRLFTLLTRVTSEHERGAVLARPDFLVLARLGRSGWLRPGDLAQLEGLDQSTLSRRIAGLAERGLVERQSDPGDRRAHLLRLTEAGLAAFEAEQARRVRLVTDAVTQWPAPELAELVRLLHELNESLQQRIAQ